MLEPRKKYRKITTVRSAAVVCGGGASWSQCLAMAVPRRVFGRELPAARTVELGHNRRGQMYP